MNQPVESKRLTDVLARYRSAYLLTVSDRGTPHAVPATAMLQDGEVVVEAIGRRTRGNALARPEAVSLLYPPPSDDGYTLIVDGRATVAGDALRIAPTQAVLHRSRPSPAPGKPGQCASDCVELALSSSDAG